jgi:serine/threonine protein kinase
VKHLQKFALYGGSDPIPYPKIARRRSQYVRDILSAYYTDEIHEIHEIHSAIDIYSLGLVAYQCFITFQLIPLPSVVKDLVLRMLCPLPKKRIKPKQCLDAWARIQRHMLEEILQQQLLPQHQQLWPQQEQKNQEFRRLMRQFMQRHQMQKQQSKHSP